MTSTTERAMSNQSKDGSSCIFWYPCKAVCLRHNHANLYEFLSDPNKIAEWLHCPTCANHRPNTLYRIVDLHDGWKW